MVNFAFFRNVCYFAFAKEKELSSAKAMAVMETSSGRILYQKNSQEKLPMASTTKIITAIVVLENIDDLETMFTATKECVGVEGTSVYLREGEALTIRELLYGLMLRSGNDAAVALAIATSGSVSEFVDLCNKFCASIGANNTHLSNPHGLTDKDHYTTASDLCLISAYALKNPEFAKIVSTRQKTISNTLNTAKNRVLNNKNKLLKNMENATGVKTGYTKAAGRCFVGSAKKDDMELVCVLLNCVPMFEECQALLEKGFAEYKMVDVLGSGEVVGEVSTENCDTKSVKIVARHGARLPLSVAESDTIEIVYDFPKVISAPQTKDFPIGKFDIYASKDLIFSGKIYIIEDVKSEEKTFGGEIVKDWIHLD